MHTLKAVFLQLYTCKHRSWLESYENKYQGLGFHRISLVPITIVYCNRKKCEKCSQKRNQFFLLYDVENYFRVIGRIQANCLLIFNMVLLAIQAGALWVKIIFMSNQWLKRAAKFTGLDVQHLKIGTTRTNF